MDDSCVFDILHDSSPSSSPSVDKQTTHKIGLCSVLVPSNKSQRIICVARSVVHKYFDGHFELIRSCRRGVMMALSNFNPMSEGGTTFSDSE